MRFHSVELYNIKSLVGRYYLPLEERFGSTELFLIYGPTGVGKTAFFDGISLALFGKTSQLEGSAKAKDQTRSVSWVKNDSCRECSVQVEFSLLDKENKRQYYRATWALSLARTGSVRNPTRTLEWLDEDGNLLEELYSGDQAKKADEAFEMVLHGLTFEDFQQTILLPQGAFAKFLKSKKEDRVQLLERITGTRHLEDICAVATKKKDEWNRRRKSLLEETEKLSIPPKEVVAEHKKEKKRCSARLEKQEFARETINRIREFQTKHLEYKQHTRIFKEEEERTENLKGQWKLLEESQKEKQVITEKAAQEFTDFKQWKSEWLPVIEQIRSLWAELSNKNKQYDSLKLKIQHSDLKIQALKAKVKESDLEVKRMLEQACDRAWTELCKEISIATEENYLSEVSKRRRTFQDKELRCSQIEILQKDLVKHQEKLKKITDDGVKNREKQTENQTTLKQLSSFLEEQEQELKIQLEAKRKGDAFFLMAEKRKELVEGKPCEVCGSLDHPYRQYNNSQHDLEARYEKIKKVVQELEQGIQKTRGDKICLEQQIHHQEALLLSKQQEYRDELQKLNKKKQEINKYFEALGAVSAENIQEIKLRLKQENQRLERINEEVSRTKNRLNQFLREQEETQRILVQIRELEEQNAAVRDESNQLQETITRDYTTLLHKASSLSNTIEEKLSLDIQHSESPTVLLREIQEVLKIQEQKRQEHHHQLRQELVSIQSRAQAYHQQILDREKQDIERKSNFETLKDVLQLKKEEAKIAFTELQSGSFAGVSAGEPSQEAMLLFLERGQEIEEEYLKDKALMNSLVEKIELYEKYKDLVQEYKEACQNYQKWDEMHIILNTKRHLVSERTNEMRPVTFREYAQIRQLQLLVQGANEHLLKMETGYQIEVLRDDDNLPTLDFVIREGSKKPRPLHTLSGGQTFLVSLAFSLGLADLRKVYLPIETLLIDEGFGSLDADYVEMVLATLEQLKERRVQVGLISHVSGVQEKVSAKVTPLELKIELEQVEEF